MLDFDTFCVGGGRGGDFVSMVFQEEIKYQSKMKIKKNNNEIYALEILFSYTIK